MYVVRWKYIFKFYILSHIYNPMKKTTYLYKKFFDLFRKAVNIADVRLCAELRVHKMCFGYLDRLIFRILINVYPLHTLLLSVFLFQQFRKLDIKIFEVKEIISCYSFFFECFQCF